MRTVSSVLQISNDWSLSEETVTFNKIVRALPCNESAILESIFGSWKGNVAKIRGNEDEMTKGLLVDYGAPYSIIGIVQL